MCVRVAFKGHLSVLVATPHRSAADKNIAPATCAQRRNDSSGSLPPPYHTHTHTHVHRRASQHHFDARARKNTSTRAHTSTRTDVNTDATKTYIRRALIF